MKKDFATFLTYSGIEIDIQNVKEEDINVNDIFHSLSLINRFCGHSQIAYSVAEHSVYCYIVATKMNLGKRIKAYALLHDASESMIGDMPTYVKQYIPQFKDIENRIESVIFSKLGLGDMTEEEKSIVKSIDNTLMLIEMRDLTRHDISKMNLINRPNYYESQSRGLDINPFSHRIYTAYGEKIKKLIDLEFGDVTELLDEEYTSTFLKHKDNYPLAYEKLMKHIYNNEFSDLAGDLK